MNFYFKLKHYLFLYFNTKFNYSFNEDAKGFNQNYWIKGYKKNIDTNKWTIEDGIPLGLYTAKMDAHMSRRVHISAMTEYCFGLTEKDEGEKQKRVVDFLVDNLHEDRLEAEDLNFMFWRTYHKNTSDSYYVHGMGQGQVLSLLTRYYLKTREKKILDALIKVSNSYLVPFEHKHAFVNRNERITVFEEYPKTPLPTVHVLNGWLLSFYGLHDYLEFVKIENINDPYLEEKIVRYQETVKTMSDMLQDYDVGFWSLYNLPKSIQSICSIHYHEHHVVMLEAMYILTGEKKFDIYSRKFKRQYKSIVCRILALFTKVFIVNLWKYKRLYKK